MFSCLVRKILAQAKPLIGIKKSSSSQKDTSKGPEILKVGFMGLTITAVWIWWCYFVYLVWEEETENFHINLRNNRPSDKYSYIRELPMEKEIKRVNFIQITCNSCCRTQH